MSTPVHFLGEADLDLPRPPTLGEHTRSVLAVFGINAGAITRLEEAGVLGSDAGVNP